jgi:hypothetical protein
MSTNAAASAVGSEMCVQPNPTVPSEIVKDVSFVPWAQCRVNEPTMGSPDDYERRGTRRIA